MKKFNGQHQQQPLPPDIHLDYESEMSDDSDSNYPIESGGKRNWIPAPEDLRPKPLNRYASIVSFEPIPGQKKMKMIVSPDGKINVKKYIKNYLKEIT